MLKTRLRLRPLAVALGLTFVAVAGCGGGGDGSSSAVKVSAPNPGEIMGFQPASGSVPNFGCTDGSYARVRKDGIKLGIVNSPPYTSMGSDNKPAGIDIDIWNAVLSYIGVDKVQYVIGGWDALVPGLTSKRIDVAAATFHENPERLKEISFTSPAWWYGPVIVVPKGNPDNVKSYADLNRDGVKVGALAGTAAFLYLEHIKGDVVPYKSSDLEFSSLGQGRESAVLEDRPVFTEYMKANPNAPIEEVTATPPPIIISDYGYGYGRYGVRKDDCTLNFAVSRALSELRGVGVISKILNSYGLDDNVYLPTANSQ
jgi:polar amino acid transport system substrate-binding protein